MNSAICSIIDSTQHLVNVQSHIQEAEVATVRQNRQETLSCFIYVSLRGARQETKPSSKLYNILEGDKSGGDQ